MAPAWYAAPLGARTRISADIPAMKPATEAEYALLLRAKLLEEAREAATEDDDIAYRPACPGRHPARCICGRANAGPNSPLGSSISGGLARMLRWTAAMSP